MVRLHHRLIEHMMISQLQEWLLKIYVHIPSRELAILVLGARCYNFLKQLLFAAAKTSVRTNLRFWAIQPPSSSVCSAITELRWSQKSHVHSMKIALRCRQSSCNSTRLVWRYKIYSNSMTLITVRASVTVSLKPLISAMFISFTFASMALKFTWTIRYIVTHNNHLRWESMVVHHVHVFHYHWAMFFSW